MSQLCFLKNRTDLWRRVGKSSPIDNDANGTQPTDTKKNFRGSANHGGTKILPHSRHMYGSNCNLAEINVINTVGMHECQLIPTASTGPGVRRTKTRNPKFATPTTTVTTQMPIIPLVLPRAPQNLGIRNRGFQWLVPIGWNTTQLEKNEVQDDPDGSGTGQSGGGPSNNEDGEEADLDASMEDMDDVGETGTASEAEDANDMTDDFEEISSNA
ncbi:uncharacterized protein F5891DRAFT_980772 [Suillus fuscotomentosus]|uniref:Uncharacterized protein n=1 Tax=Suillus fuscotomentosus TaxID=1912939 RepID=A0AAD4HJD7_9AGAM|nr:uncharacterized protein F5891DRAFT_980772 [Suillus fuscotomentosus]KAG1899820.1 hypothetical protein F5891DRAFT_980772 [Suillus fuscotomentosus]